MNSQKDRLDIDMKGRKSAVPVTQQLLYTRHGDILDKTIKAKYGPKLTNGMCLFFLFKSFIVMS